MTDYDKVVESLARLIIVDCGYESEYPCPHAHPTAGYEKCPHLDEDICMWQREQAREGFDRTKINNLTLSDLIKKYLELVER